MSAVINKAYKPILERAINSDVPVIDKLTQLLEEMCEKKDREGNHLIDDYTTMAHAVLIFMEAHATDHSGKPVDVAIEESEG